LENAHYKQVSVHSGLTVSGLGRLPCMCSAVAIYCSCSCLAGCRVYAIQPGLLTSSPVCSDDAVDQIRSSKLTIAQKLPHNVMNLTCVLSRIPGLAFNATPGCDGRTSLSPSRKSLDMILQQLLLVSSPFTQKTTTTPGSEGFCHLGN